MASALMAIGLVAAPISASAKDLKPQELSEQTEEVKQNETFDFSFGLGFGYRTLKVGDNLDDYVDLTRQNFEPSMPGFKDFMQLGHQLPYLSLELAVEPTKWHVFSGDSLEFFVSGDFSSSAIFGSTTNKETYDASVQAIKLGPTPSTWTQELNFYQATGFGARYSPTELKLGSGFKFRPSLAVKGGVSYLDSNSILHIHVNDDHPENTTQGITWDVLNQFNVYQDIRTDADCYGTGYFAEASLGLGVEWEDLNLRFNGGYRSEPISTFKVEEKTVSDGKVEKKETEHKYDASGWNLLVQLNYEF